MFEGENDEGTRWAAAWNVPAQACCLPKQPVISCCGSTCVAGKYVYKQHTCAIQKAANELFNSIKKSWTRTNGNTWWMTENAISHHYNPTLHIYIHDFYTTDKSTEQAVKDFLYHVSVKVCTVRSNENVAFSSWCKLVRCANAPIIMKNSQIFCC